MKRALAVAMTLLPAVGAMAEGQGAGSGFTKEHLAAVAAVCGTSVSFVNFPANAAQITKTSFGFALDSHATASQRQCFDAKVPHTRVMVIGTSPSSSAKKN